MHFAIAILIFCFGQSGEAIDRPPNVTPYFPNKYRWYVDDVGSQNEGYFGRNLQPMESQNFIEPEEMYTKYGLFQDKPFTSEEIKEKAPSFNRYKDQPYRYEDIPAKASNLNRHKGVGGYNPPSFADLNKVYWWEKRFNKAVPPFKDVPFFDYDFPDDIDPLETGFVKKRDYTAAQLVNMLKALARARRHRQSRVVGKALRFGISK